MYIQNGHISWVLTFCLMGEGQSKNASYDPQVYSNSVNRVGWALQQCCFNLPLRVKQRIFKNEMKSTIDKR
jgi:hypothetical protein